MGKKKDKLRAREAEAARQSQLAAGMPAKTGTSSFSGPLSSQYEPMGDFSGSPPGYYQGPPGSAPSTNNPQWPAMDAVMAANGLTNNGWPSSYPMPAQIMNGLQGLNNMSMFQPNGFFPMQPIPNQGFGIMGMPQGRSGSSTAAFSTSSQSMFPGQPPYPSEAHYYQQPTPQPVMSPELPDRTRPGKKRPASPAGAAATTKPPGRAAITAPGAASGGIPDPTPSYLVRASFLPKRRAQPGPLLVVIDLNGTLLHRPDKRRPFNFRARPHAHSFVSYCIETFWVVIWSSARPDNVKRMVEELASPEQLGRVVAVWGRDRFGLTPEDYNARTQCYKRLTALWADPAVRASYPGDREGFEGRCWDQGNTVLIDDSVEKARSEPHNAITIPEFTGDASAAPGILPMVHDYLNELCFQEDVSTYIRANPFKMA